LEGFTLLGLLSSLDLKFQSNENYRGKIVGKRIVIFTTLLLLSLVLGNYIPIDQEFPESKIIGNKAIVSADNPPFEAPPLNANVMDNGSLWVNGQEMFWRFFFPNTTSTQPLNFGFSFEVWWKNPNPGIIVVFNLTEIEGESSIEPHYGTVDNHEKVIQTPEGDFVQYAIWSNSTYFFANETWASLGNANIDGANLNLSLGIQHDTYFPIFEYSIHRDTVGPSIQIIHPNYNELKHELTLNESVIDFEINVTDESDIESVFLIGYFLNQTTEEIDEMILWEDFDVENGEDGRLYMPSLITEKYVNANGGTADIDEYSIISEFVLLDSFGQETREHLTIIVNNQNTNFTTTTTTQGSDTPLPVVVGVGSIFGIAVIYVIIKRR